MGISYNPHQRKIFDAHSHIGRFGQWVMKGNTVEPFRGREITSVEDQRAYMKKLGVAKAIVMPHYTPDQAVPFAVFNPLVLETVAKLDNVYGAMWVSPLPENTERTQHVLQQFPLKKIVALKMSPDSWPKGKYTPDPATWDSVFRKNMESILDAARKHDLVIQTHTGSDNSDVLQYISFVATHGKDVTIQFVHMGGSAGGHFAFVPRFIRWLQEGYRFYCDTSFCRGFGPAWLIREMQEKWPQGLQHILFASDHPWGLFESEFLRIEALDISDTLKHKLFYQNASELYEG